MSGHPSRDRPAASSRFGAGTTAAALGLLLAIVGCGLSAPEREEARAVVEANNRDAPVQIVTSTEFTVGSGSGGDATDPPSGPSVGLLTADTTVQSLPFERTFDISATGRFFIRAQTPAAATDTPSVNASIRVIVDGEERNSVQGDLADDPVQAVFVSGN